MKCPKCGYEPRERLLHIPCPECGYVWWDTESYVTELASEMGVKSVLDIGCGNKGIIAQHYWENVAGIERGYACDIHVIKDLPSLWTPLKVDAETLLDHLKPGEVDFITHCGMLEHVDYCKALRILRVLELLKPKRIFFTCSTVLREVDYKVKRDGNPYHYYKSFWDADIFSALGYTCDVKRMQSGETFRVEIPCWLDLDAITAPWDKRLNRVIDAFDERAEHGCYECGQPTVGWDPALPWPHWFCEKHSDPFIAEKEDHRFARLPIQAEGYNPYPPLSVDEIVEGYERLL